MAQGRQYLQFVAALLVLAALVQAGPVDILPGRGGHSIVQSGPRSFMVIGGWQDFNANITEDRINGPQRQIVSISGDNGFTPNTTVIAPTLTIPLSDSACQFYAQKAYCVGGLGNNDTALSASMAVIDPANPQGIQQVPIILGGVPLRDRWDVGSVLLGSTMYLYAGNGSEGYRDEVVAIDLTISPFQARRIDLAGSLPIFGNSPCAAAINSTTFIIFGGLRSGQVNRIVRSINIETREYRDLSIQVNLNSVSGVPAVRSRTTCIGLNGRFYIFGGHNGNGPLNDLWVLDPNTLIWEQLSASTEATMLELNQPTRRFDSVMHGAGQHLIIYGGYDIRTPEGRSYANDTRIYFYNTNSKKWTTDVLAVGDISSGTAPPPAPVPVSTPSNGTAPNSNNTGKQDTSTSSTSSNVGAIVGGTVGGAVGLVAAGVAIMAIQRKRTGRKSFWIPSEKTEHTVLNVSVANGQQTAKALPPVPASGPGSAPVRVSYIPPISATPPPMTVAAAPARDSSRPLSALSVASQPNSFSDEDPRRRGLPHVGAVLFVPEHNARDEITISPNDVVYVREMFADGWAKGFNHTTRAEGYFPYNCVRNTQ
ncbi:uncharacterized protein SPPG_02262 [Spizellomyces punctatus DAOM BR117]|uniref:SH3 domain-containing protein n=1 Tax=Spizellomyces punctatus (strain DAOM BR117) TaxID=645134 RepID=A0A0L0HQH6_SPIPD|nr:uncharacterized protein SPPG_02262 [Spizellomyces punctatus DAOM BR117]KND03205.1 hypothetical protein SPPG_02262 [Spizellomyces punctatus DAOM BR117]|eukprot:XP_016611244.1 hypothetical protein SPPG_02262 [Spizellomyces punctatus DAOM BR117]